MSRRTETGPVGPSHGQHAETLRVAGVFVREVRLLLAVVAPMAVFGTKTLWEHFGL